MDNFLLMKLWKFSLSNLAKTSQILCSKNFIDFDEIFISCGQIS